MTPDDILDQLDFTDEGIVWADGGLEQVEIRDQPHQAKIVALVQIDEGRDVAVLMKAVEFAIGERIHGVGRARLAGLECFGGQGLGLPVREFRQGPEGCQCPGNHNRPSPCEPLTGPPEMD